MELVEVRTLGQAWLEVAHRILDNGAEANANFFEPRPVTELGGADSYATRLFDSEHSGRDQLPAAYRHDIHPVRVAARLLAA